MSRRPWTRRAAGAAVTDGDRGTIQVLEPVSRIWVGGQALWIDQVCASP